MNIQNVLAKPESNSPIEHCSKCGGEIVPSKNMKVLQRFKLGDTVYTNSGSIFLQSVKIYQKYEMPFPNSEYYNYQPYLPSSLLVSNYSTNGEVDDSTPAFLSKEDLLRSHTGEVIEYARHTEIYTPEFNLGDTVYYFGRGNRLRVSTITAIDIYSNLLNGNIINIYEYRLTSKNKGEECEYSNGYAGSGYTQEYHTEVVAARDIYKSREEYIKSNLI